MKKANSSLSLFLPLLSCLSLTETFIGTHFCSFFLHLFIAQPVKHGRLSPLTFDQFELKCNDAVATGISRYRSFVLYSCQELNEYIMQRCKMLVKSPVTSCQMETFFIVIIRYFFSFFHSSSSFVLLFYTFLFCRRRRCCRLCVRFSSLSFTRL